MAEPSPPGGTNVCFYDRGDGAAVSGLHFTRPNGLGQPSDPATGRYCHAAHGGRWRETERVLVVEPAGIASTPERQARIVIDADGVEWEVYDEGEGSIGLVLDWDHMPQLENPGLIFCSRLDRRRVWPCPPNWRRLSNDALLSLVQGATSIR